MDCRLNKAGRRQGAAGEIAGEKSVRAVGEKPAGRQGEQGEQAPSASDQLGAEVLAVLWHLPPRFWMERSSAELPTPLDDWLNQAEAPSLRTLLIEVIYRLQCQNTPAQA